MRRIWAIGLLVASLAAISAAMVFRRGPDELEFLRPYWTGSSTSYFEYQTSAGTTEYWQSRAVKAKGKSVHDLIEVVRAHYDASAGWKGSEAVGVLDASSGSYMLYIYKAWKTTRTNSLTGVVDARNEDDDTMSVQVSRLMSYREVLAYRICHFGQMPS